MPARRAAWGDLSPSSEAMQASGGQVLADRSRLASFGADRFADGVPQRDELRIGQLA